MSGNLPPDPSDLIVSALQLSVVDRVAVAKAMLESVEGTSDVSQEDVDAAWDKEIERRVGEVESGRVETISSAALWKQLGGKPDEGN